MLEQECWQHMFYMVTCVHGDSVGSVLLYIHVCTYVCTYVCLYVTTYIAVRYYDVHLLQWMVGMCYEYWKSTTRHSIHGWTT